MSTYLLLRDNKENGPYTFDELKAKGLKAYDLVWVEGRSAAWRYPCELEELKPFAPVVLEQPFDRFFKKPSQENKPVLSTENESPKEKPLVREQETPKLEAEKPLKGIYVTLPAGKQTAILDEKFHAEARETSSPAFKPVISETMEVSSSQVKAVPQERAFAPAAKTANSKREFVLFYPNATSLKKPALFILSAAALMAAGIYIGMNIGHRSDNGDKANPLPVEQVASKPLIESSQNPGTEGSNAAELHPDKVTSTPAVNRPVENVQENNRNKINPPAEKKIKTEEPSGGSQVAAQAPPTRIVQDSNALIPVTRREATHRSDLTEKENTSSGSLVNLISLSTNKYSVGTFGGISDVQLTVTNHSAKAIDLVVVEVSYVLANKKIYKTENLYFRNINGGAAIMEEAPKSPRGIKVEYKVSQITPRDASLSSASIR